MAVKFAYEGPRGRTINTRKRVKLFLGLCGDNVPDLFYDLRSRAVKKDPHLQIEFFRFIPPKKYGEDVRIDRFDKN